MYHVLLLLDLTAGAMLSAMSLIISGVAGAYRDSLMAAFFPYLAIALLYLVLSLDNFFVRSGTVLRVEAFLLRILPLAWVFGVFYFPRADPNQAGAFFYILGFLTLLSVLWSFILVRIAKRLG